MTTRMIMAAIFICIFCSTVFAGTTTEVLLDLSGSVLVDNAGSEGKDSPYNRNLSELKAEINALNKGNSIVVTGFARKSDVTLLKATMPKQAGPMNQNLLATKILAVKKLHENLVNKGKSIDSTRTDLIGGIYRASRLLEETSEGAEKRRLIILSDMIDNESLGMSLSRMKSVGSHRVFLRKLDGVKSSYPNLNGVEVKIFSAFSDIKALTTVETEIAIKELKQFWLEYFKRCGASVQSYQTNY